MGHQRRAYPRKRPHDRTCIVHEALVVFTCALTDAPRPRVSPVAGAPGCQPRTGVLHVRGAGVDGFVSRGSNGFGEYVVSRERGEALMVVFGCGGDVSDLRTTNGFATFPLLGAIQGFSSDNAELRPNALNYLYLGGVAQTAQGARPALVGNSFSTATNDAEASESAIWVVGQAGQVSVRWVNPDGSIPPNNIVYVGGRNVLAIVGDVAAFVAAVENASVVTLTFEA
ncbi:hypothetical protein BDY19DRAFT_372956 [Irpex rosettiformis]|uniref:Uncharacterized protein n=1 Tax=Irpex rosettiformis TaxID=378272 RepID=A0ACB8TVA1_9APHY|nr:hypothetical protein BDY19DRAFT_372956 [Irpex rosettiformis]